MRTRRWLIAVHSPAGALLFVDTVCTLGGVPLNVDADELDIVYSGSQKCLGAPPGASPLTLSEKATAKLAARKTKVRPVCFSPYGHHSLCLQLCLSLRSDGQNHLPDARAF